MSEGPRPLDSIVSLSVALAESPGSFAFFLGSGVSRDAGVPTGGEVLTNALNDLYRLENPDDPPLDSEAMAKWLEETGRSKLTYSEVLELLGPEPEGRRAYLAKYFEGHEPADTHRLLAALAAEGFVRVFITTNFDRLLEKALDDVGMTPIVVTTDEDLRRATGREHAKTYLLKIHGDYLQQTIRNTAEELAQLEPRIEAELREVVDRFGLVIVGYSGSDQAVKEVFQERQSPYGAYWVTRAEPTGETAGVIETMRARAIQRDSAGEFLRDLRRRIAAFQEHPSGETPEIVASEVIGLLRTRDEVGLSEKMRTEWRALEAQLESVIEPRLQQTTAPDEDLIAVEHELLPAMERMFASLLPLVDYGPELFDEQTGEMRRLYEKAHLVNAPTTWPHLRQWSVWWLAQVCGAYAVARARFSVVGTLLRAVVENDSRSSIAAMYPTKLGFDLTRAALSAESSQNWIAPEWQHLIERLGASPFIQERYDLLTEPPGVQRWLDDFNFLTSIDAVRQGYLAIAYWGFSSSGGLDLARRIARDPVFRNDLASECFGISGDEFAATVKAEMRDAIQQPGRQLFIPQDGFWWSNAVDELPEPPSGAE